MSRNGNVVSINKGMFVIIVILVAIVIMFAIDMLFLYKRDVMRSGASGSNSGNLVIKGISFEDKIKLDGIIGTGNSGLSFLLGKDSINNIDNNDMLYYIYREYLSDKFKTSEGVSFTKEDVKKAFSESAFSNKSYSDSDIIDRNYGDNAIIWKYDSSSGTYSYNSLGIGGSVVSTNIVYTYNIDSYVEDGKYIVVNKYLFSNSYADVTGNDNKVTIYGDYNSAVKGSCIDCDSSGSYLTELDNVYSSEDVDRYAISNYDSIKDRLDTYTYTFENRDGHFVLSDYSVKHSK